MRNAHQPTPRMPAEGVKRLCCRGGYKFLKTRRRRLYTKSNQVAIELLSRAWWCARGVIEFVSVAGGGGHEEGVVPGRAY